MFENFGPSKEEITELSTLERDLYSLRGNWNRGLGQG